MPRPKPPEPLRERCVRLSDSTWRAIQQRGGQEWLRRHLQRELHTRPADYWSVFKKESHHA